MRGFTVLCTLVALSAAAPQQGYQYAAQSSDGQLQFSGVSSSTAEALKDLQTVMAVQSANLGPNFELGKVAGAASATAFLGQPQPRYLPAVSSVQQQQQVPKLQQQQVQQQISLQQQQRVQQPQQIALQQQQIPQQSSQQQQLVEPKTVITKRFFLHAAPEDAEEEVQERHITIGKARKSYNVVFIKSSNKAAKKASIKITPAANEEKTVIYVLNKKQDAADIDAQVYEPATTTTKPEVFFIKYKTAEEAAHAQQTIQAQYDALGGSTQVSNEGVAPVSSVIGSLEVAKQAEAATGGNNEAAQVSRGAQAEELVKSAGVQSQGERLTAQVQLSQSANANNAYLPPVRYYYR
ncbi:probable basic-leucine zipper transcription factor R [Rhagoletis pomonella]|uniref:probable basic-leucine zipper transcription factor R n=1 Tax=Rhagoletis pomonella TaxID=28610 RepID=UPI00177B04A5|nr:probable basic-leucine zipper transcription factor R [Rhagoletis pomonella]